MNIYHFSIGPNFGSQHPHEASQQSETPVLGTLKPPFGFHRCLNAYVAHKLIQEHTYTHTQIYKSFKRSDEEMTQGFRVLAPPSENLGSVSSTHKVADSHLYSFSSSRADALSGISRQWPHKVHRHPSR